MSDPADVVATVAQNGGAGVAIASAAFGIPNAVFGWLNHNSAGVLALCGIGGLLISWFGYRAKRLHMQQMVDNELRMKERRI